MRHKATSSASLLIAPQSIEEDVVETAVVDLLVHSLIQEP